MRAVAALFLAAVAWRACAQPLCDLTGTGSDPRTCSLLQTFYQSTNGETWLDNSGWADAFSSTAAGAAPDYCDFQGVFCTADGFVWRFDMGFVGISGTIPPALGQLVNVSDLRLDVNQLSGTIPSALCALTNLELLVLVSNRLSGSLPDCLGSLKSLTLLRADNNVLEGSIPASIASLSNLRLLGLNNNRISGSVPDEIGALTQLRSLSLSGNLVQGTLPGDALAALTALTYMNMRTNGLSGELPVALGSLTGLTLLNLEDNALQGTVPEQFSALTALQYLGLQDNRLGGSIPASLAALTALQELTLRSNAFNGTVPAALSALTRLTYLWLDTNKLSGTIPSGALSQLTVLTVLTLDDNALSGTLPSALGVLPHLQRFSASNNALSGPLPDAYANLTVLQRLSLGGNNFTGALPLSWAALSALTYLDLSSNALSGAVPPQWAAGMASLAILDLSHNPALGPAPGALATLPATPCGTTTEAYDAVLGCVCAPGFSLAAGRTCSPCAPGSYTSEAGSASCALCPANTYSAASGTACVTCPPGSTAPAGSPTLSSCSCAYGTFASAGDSGLDFECLPCPENAVCPGPDAPLAQEGYWHEPNDHSVFYACATDMCLAETPGMEAANASNCATGRTGVVCGECQAGYAEEDKECVPCRPSDAFEAWSTGSKAGAIIGAILLLVLGSYVFFLRPLGGPLSTGPSSPVDPGADKGESTEARSTSIAVVQTVTLFAAVMDVINEPFTIVLESLQIVSSFHRTMYIKWPPLYFRVMAKLNIVNFSFLRFPKTACATPNVSFYAELNGITLGVTGLLLWIVVLWLGGNAYARLRALPASQRSKFNANIMAHSMVVLNIVYAPVSEAVVAVFACRKVGDKSWLFRDISSQCGTAEHRFFVRLAIFWVVLYVVGIPLIFVALLVYYRVPHTARRVRRIAMLRGVVDLAWWRGIEQPEGVNTSLLTEENISEEHLDALFKGLRLEQKRKRSWRLAAALMAGRARRRLLGGGDGYTGPVAAAEHVATPVESFAPEPLTRAERLDVVQAFARNHVQLTHFTWEDVAGSADDLRRPGVECIDHLYLPFYPGRWYFGLIQNMIKLVLTSLLLFIVPGTPAQIVAGLCISFFVLLWYLRLLPYAEKSCRQVAYSAYLVIFLFFVLALLLKMDVPVTPNDTLFYAAFCGILVFSLFVFPAVAVLRAGKVKIHKVAAGSKGDTDDGEETAADDDAANAEHGRTDDHTHDSRALSSRIRTTRRFERTAFHPPVK